MDEEQSAWDKFKGVYKGFAKSAIKPTIIVILIIAICIPLFWSVTEIDANDVAHITSGYTTTVNSEGKIVYKKAEASKDGDTNAEENNTGETGEEGDEIDSDAIAEELADVLSKYILNGDKKEQIKHLMDTEEMTRMPYIDPASLPKKEESEGDAQPTPDADEGENADADKDEEDDEPLGGTIYFYRYNKDNEDNEEEKRNLNIQYQTSFL